MAEQEFRGFFSYARDDEETDPGLIRALTTELERRVNARLVNVRLVIWRDTERLRVGERWDETIDRELRRADVLIVLLTPRWIGSEYCRREYALFEELEASRKIGQYVVPILARSIEEQQRRLTPEQRDTFGRINQRQHFQVLATDFLRLPRARRNAEIDKLAAEIVGSILRLSLTAAAEAPGPARADLAVFRDAEFAPELVVIPAGEFMIETEEEYENERPQHRVTIGQRFAIGRYPVTFAEYDRFCEARRQEKPADRGGRGRQPVINVSWGDAQAYIAWLSQETDRTYRLPSDAEWEYACRAGTTSRYSFGDLITPREANYTDSGLSRTSEVGSYPANRWGLHDMHGNVGEWVEDGWHDHYCGAPTDGSAWKDAKGSADSRLYVLRGGSWYVSRWLCRSACRDRYGSDDRRSYVGFRVARTLS